MKKRIIQACVMLCILFAAKLSAQVTPSCEWNVDNRLECSIVVDVQFFNGANPPCTSACTVQTFTISANSTQQVTCNCSNPCNVKLTVVSAGGTLVGTST